MSHTPGVLPLQAVSTFEMPAPAVAAHMRAVAQLHRAVAAGSPPWSAALLTAAERVLSAFVASVGTALHAVTPACACNLGRVSRIMADCIVHLALRVCTLAADTAMTFDR